jgi:hypothetical protein
MSLSLETFMARFLTEHNGSLPILQDNAKITSFQRQSVERIRRNPATLSFSMMECSMPECSMDAPRLPSRSSDSLSIQFDYVHKVSKQPRTVHKVSKQPRTGFALESKPLSIRPSSAAPLRLKSRKKYPANVHRVARWA